MSKPHQKIANVTPMKPNEIQETKAMSVAIQKTKSLPEGFSFGEKGLSYIDPHADNPSPILICSKLEVTAITCDENYMNYGRVLEFKDPLGKDKKWVMPMNMLSGRGDALHGILLDMGLYISPSSRAKNLLAQYLHECKGEYAATCVFKTGWFNGCYVLPNKTIGGTRENNVLFQTENPLLINFENRGTLEMWQNHVASFAVGNSRISFAISCAFTAPLLREFGIEGGGFHYRGASSSGKTTALYVAGSVWGSHKRKRTWRATSNGLEYAAYSHNDSLLCLDEMGEMSPKEIGQTVYMLSNGQAKQRANDLRLKEWRLLFLSSGELDLKSAMSSAGDTAKAGQEVRMIDLEAVAGDFGVFDTLLEGFSESKSQAESLHQNTAEYFGVAGLHFLEQFIHRKDEAREFFKKIQNEFIRAETPQGSNSQVRRAINRFAIVAAGGELATMLGVTRWGLGEAYHGALVCFKSWLDNLASSSESHEEISAIKLVKGFISRHAESRFTNLKRSDDDHAPRTLNRAGWRQDKPTETYYHFIQEVFNEEVCNGLDPRLVLKTLKKHNYLKTESGGKTQRLTFRGLRIGENQKVNTYAVSAEILEHENNPT